MPVATADALVGLGLPEQLAQLLGGNPNVLTCVGTTQATTTAIIKSTNTELITAGGANACILPATPDNVNVMVPYNIVNPTATLGLIFAPSGHTMNTGAALVLNGNVNAATGLAQFKSCLVWQYKPKFWTFILTA